MGDHDEPIDLVFRVAARMRGGELGDDGLRFAQALDRYLEFAHAGLTLDQAAGVKPTDGARPWWQIAAKRRRNQALCEVCQLFCKGLVETLRAEIFAYQRGQWGRDRDLPECRAAYRGTARELLFLAFRENDSARCPMPTSIKQLRRILAARPSGLSASPRRSVKVGG